MDVIRRLPGGWWSIVFPVGSGVLACVLAVSDDTTPPAAAVGYLTLAVLGIGWLFVGSRGVDDGPASVPFMAVVVVATSVLCAVNPSLAFVQAIAYPYAWEFSARRVRTVAAHGAIAAAVVVGFTVHGGTAGWLVSGLATAGLSVGFSFAMGFWITSIAAAAAERGKLQAQVEAMGEELADAHREAGAAAERERFAHEIHDTLTQTLTAVVMLTERAGREMGDAPDAAAATIGVAERTARQALAETRALIAEGQGIGVGADGITARITRLCAQFAEESGIRVDTDIVGSLEGVDRPTQVVLLRCLQEALANVRKHANASTVVVELSNSDGVTLAITDDGVGFPDGVDAATARGYGLAGISGRLALSNGTLTITTGAEGTRLSVRMPAGTPGRQGAST